MDEGTLLVKRPFVVLNTVRKLLCVARNGWILSHFDMKTCIKWVSKHGSSNYGSNNENNVIKLSMSTDDSEE